jgi:DNA-directed RNA polymerase sigma subunit (sigma70/sigma32)
LTSLGELPPDNSAAEEAPSERLRRLGELLHSDHPLLSSREKVVLTRRFGLTEQADPPTLEQLGHDLGLSKERVRQVQAAALVKLRKALDEVTPLRLPA